jgi:Flp pilus assembly pilin Flp
MQGVRTILHRRAQRGRSHQRGGALVEYWLVVSLVVLVLIAKPDLMHQLADALKKAYASFVYALSISWI